MGSHLKFLQLSLASNLAEMLNPDIQMLENFFLSNCCLIQNISVQCFHAP